MDDSFLQGDMAGQEDEAHSTMVEEDEQLVGDADVAEEDGVGPIDATWKKISMQRMECWYGLISARRCCSSLAAQRETDQPAT